MDLPAGFRSYVASVGIKDGSDDLVVIATTHGPATASGVFTRSLFAGPSVALSRDALADHRATAVVVISKNANVATGERGAVDAREVVDAVAGRLGCDAGDVLLASTGVIGVPYPMERVRAGIAVIPDLLPLDTVDAAAAGIITTDTVPKLAAAAVVGSDAVIVGIAKGVGMIEPDMATMIAVLTTDAEIGPDELDLTFRRVVDRTFNCVSIDTDTSTSDTAVILASGARGPVDPAAFEVALEEVALTLTKAIAADGEGAETLVEVHVDGARDVDQAKRVGKAIVNSPLVKTAVHGADPNWGRVAMAIGKCQDDTDIDPRHVVIRFAHCEVYPAVPDDELLGEIAEYLAGDEVQIHVSLGTGDHEARVWGCDLTDGYVRINADYTS